MRSNYEIRFLLTLTLSAVFAGCSLFLGDEDAAKKNTHIKFEAPPSPYLRLSITTADTVWQSQETGNSIAINSTCKKNAEKNLSALENNLLLGIEHLKIINETSEKLDGQDARRVVAEGKSEGVAIQADLVILEKNDCTYDLAYIARKKTYETEHGIFDKFLPGFHAP